MRAGPTTSRIFPKVAESSEERGGSKGHKKWKELFVNEAILGEHIERAGKRITFDRQIIDKGKKGDAGGDKMEQRFQRNRSPKKRVLTVNGSRTKAFR
jgi:hypothetical protein